MKRWFEKYVGCEFYLPDEYTGGNEGTYIFGGTCEHSDHDNKRDPLQYEFYAEGKPQVLLPYKQARQVMGAMIEYNTYGRRSF